MIERTYFFVQRTVSELPVPLDPRVSIWNVALGLRSGDSKGFTAVIVCASEPLIVVSEFSQSNETLGEGGIIVRIVESHEGGLGCRHIVRNGEDMGVASDEKVNEVKQDGKTPSS